MTKQSQTPSNTPQKYKTARAFDDMLDQYQWIAPADMKRLQNASLQGILKHALKTTPFYAERLAPFFGKDEVADLSRWLEVPFLTRQDVQENFDALKSTACPPAHGRISEVKSSGSTGTPVKVLTTLLAKIAANVAAARGMRWVKIDHNLTQAQIIPPKTKENIAFPGKKMKASWGPFWIDGASSGNWYQLDYATQHPQQLEWLAERGRCYLNTMPGNARQLALLTGKYPQLNIDLAGIQTLGELVSAGLRQQVRDAFGCEIYDSYSTKELDCIATQCSHNTNLHAADELFLLEIINEETGKPVAVGETGAVVVTSFYNQAMPLIRYRLGDLATLGAPCPCGRGLTVLSAIAGRNRQLFRFPGGKTTMPDLSTADYVKLLGARKWQAAQTGDTVIEIRFVSDAPEEEQDRAAFAAAANKHFPLELTYVFKQLDAIPNLSSGKFFEHICELPENES